MAIYNLTDTAWELNSSFPEETYSVTYNVFFVSKGKIFKGIGIFFNGSYGSISYYEQGGSGYKAHYDSGQWDDDDYRFITFLSNGEDEANRDLISWLESHATLLTSDVDILLGDSKIASIDSTCSIVLDTNREYLTNDITINYKKWRTGGTIDIASNGTYNVAGYSFASVLVTGGGDPTDFIENHDTYSSFANSSATKIAPYTFYSCKSLKTVDFQACSIIGASAFANCTSLTTISFPECTQVHSGAFYSCASLSSASLSKCTIIRTSAFYSCKKLSTIYAPICSHIQASAFYGAVLTSADFPSVSNAIGIQAFAYCSSMETINFPQCSSLAASAFIACYKLKSVELQKCKYFAGYAFSNCSSLSVVSLPMMSVMAGSSNFYRCYHLVSLYLLGSSVAKLSNSNTFSSTPIAGYTTSTGGVYGSIYVPSSLYSSYIASTNWTYFSSRFVSV